MSDDVRFGSSVAILRGFLDDLGTFLLTVSKHSRQSNLDIFFSASVASISAERDLSNEADADLPAVLPYELVDLRVRYFRIIVRNHCDRLLTR